MEQNSGRYPWGKSDGMFNGSTLMAAIEKFELKDWKLWRVDNGNYYFVRGDKYLNSINTEVIYDEMCIVGTDGKVDWFEAVEAEGMTYDHVRSY